MQRAIDLNCDLGEGAGHDAELMPLISSANIACGAHAGNLDTMIEAVELALRARVAIGAHPGYFDLDGFGRVERDISPAEAGRLVLVQVEQLYEIAGDKLRHVKLHGALYNQVARDAALAEGVVAELARLWPQLALFAPAGSALAETAKARGLRLVREAFVDRTYRADGSLTPRGEPHAVITDPAAAVEQALQILRTGSVKTPTGDIPLRADSLCIHGDGAHACALARHVRAAIEQAGARVRAPALSRLPV